jgi:hypothetical protein
MPPQQHNRLLDLIDDALNFRAHDDFRWQVSAANRDVFIGGSRRIRRPVDTR